MKLLFIQSTAPHGSINAQEGLDAVLMGSAFTECTLLLVGEGILQLIKNQVPENLGIKNFSKTFGALREYGVSRIYCSKSSMTALGVDVDDMTIEVEPLGDSAIQSLIEEHDQVLNF